MTELDLSSFHGYSLDLDHAQSDPEEVGSDQWHRMQNGIRITGDHYGDGQVDLLLHVDSLYWFNKADHYSETYSRMVRHCKQVHHHEATQRRVGFVGRVAMVQFDVTVPAMQAVLGGTEQPASMQEMYQSAIDFANKQRQEAVGKLDPRWAVWLEDFARSAFRSTIIVGYLSTTVENSVVQSQSEAGLFISQTGLDAADALVDTIRSDRLTEDERFARIAYLSDPSKITDGDSQA